MSETNEQPLIQKIGRALFNFIKPDIPKLVLLAIFCSSFLIISNQIFTLPLSTCPMSTLDTTYYGLPFSFYSYDRLQNSNFSSLYLILNILIYYFIVCILVNYAYYGIRSFKHNDNTAKLIFSAISINLAVVLFVSLYIMSPDWLVKSIRKQQYTIANILMMVGTDPDSISIKHRRYTLHEAVRHNNVPLTKLVLSYGASINKLNDKGQSALHIAASRNAINAAKHLLRAGFDPNVRDQNGRTPAHFACSLPMANLLLIYKADPHIEDKNKKLPQHVTNNLELKKLWASIPRPKHQVNTTNNIDRTRNKTRTTNLTNTPKPAKPVSGGSSNNFDPHKKLSGCSHSIGGTLFANGKQYAITIAKSGAITAYSGIHGFAYAKCPDKGFYHIIIETKGHKPRLYKNLFHESGSDSPLSVAKKETALIQLSIVTGNAKIYWYFSKNKIQDLTNAIKQAIVSGIGTNNLIVRPTIKKVTNNR